MGGFNLPLFIFFILVTTGVAAGLLLFTSLSKLLVLLVTPVSSYAGLFALFRILDLIARHVERGSGKMLFIR